MKYGDVTLKARPVTLHHSDTGKSDGEDAINHLAGYEGPESGVLGTCKYFSFTLIASLNRHTGPVLVWGRRGVLNGFSLIIAEAVFLTLGSETDFLDGKKNLLLWLIAANNTTPLQVTRGLFLYIKKITFYTLCQRSRPCT